MKTKKRPSLTFSQAVEGYDLYADARGLSPNTKADYHNSFRKFTVFLQDDPDPDPALAAVTADQIREFLSSFEELTKKTVLNYYTALCALWTWAVKEGIVEHHTPHDVEPPDPERRAVEPFTESDLRLLLNSLGLSRSYARPLKRDTQHTLPNAERNRAIILLMLDTGLRATELCTLQLRCLDLRNRTIKVFGKGSAERILPFSARTGQAIQRYTSQYRREATVDKTVFITQLDNPMDRDQLRKMLGRLGERAAVRDCHPHRFRHTFAITYLRNGGDPWSLQMMLGHATMDMVRKYLAIAQADLNSNHRRASPVDNWKL